MLLDKPVLALNLFSSDFPVDLNSYGIQVIKSSSQLQLAMNAISSSPDEFAESLVLKQELFLKDHPEFVVPASQSIMQFVNDLGQ